MTSVARAAPPANLAAEKYRQVFEKRGPDEIRLLAQVKRFLERYQGDPQFRNQLDDATADLRLVAKTYEIDIDPRQVLPLFHSDHRRFPFAEGDDRWPLVKVWDNYRGELLALRDASHLNGSCAEASPRFHAWRRRQINRCASELGPLGSDITHPIVAFELSAGCSIGCWFCGVSAERFQGSFPYTQENARSWRAMIEEAADMFGPAVQHGFCYWATDPSDNPDYPKFLEDYYLLTGSLPQTTTAAPFKDLVWTRQVMDLYNNHRCMPNRFSILTLKTLDRVHATFTAEELIGVELVLHNRGSLQNRAVVGRARERQQTALRSFPPEGSTEVAPENSTIACVSGFLVNMVKRSVQLITPTMASDRWPLGYRIFGTRNFVTPRDFRAALEDLIAAHMPENLAPADVVNFRKDLSYERDPSGFQLRSHSTGFAFKGFTGAGLLGDLIHQGSMTVGEIQAVLTRSDHNIFVIASALQKLFEHGVLTCHAPD
jgi:radical SAM family RiPP maturation amino acid epimerase